VKLDKLLKRLKKDAAASPQKAGALGLMILVAIYFWAPLVFKSKGKTKTAIVAGKLVILTDDPIIAKAAPHPATNVAHWDRVRTAIAADQFMVAARHDASWQQPFARLHTIKTAQAPLQTGEPGEPVERNRAAAGPMISTSAVEPAVAKAALASVSLSMILISSRDRAAMIRGSVYRVGDVLALGGEAGQPAVELLVCDIDADGVDLLFQQEKLRLERTKPKLSPGDQLRKH
jgi:hypothetical protein